MNYFQTFGINVGHGKYHEEVVYSIALAFNLLNNEMTAYLKDFSLTPAQFNVLMILKFQVQEGGTSQVEISQRLIVTASNITRLLDKMEIEKLIERSSQEGDRRVKLIRITEKGIKLLDAVYPGYAQLLANLTQGLNSDDQRNVSEKLVKLVNNLAEER